MKNNILENDNNEIIETDTLLIDETEEDTTCWD